MKKSYELPVNSMVSEAGNPISFFDQQKIGDLLDKKLGKLGAKHKYSHRDVWCSLIGLIYCGQRRMEQVKWLNNHPLFSRVNIPSPDAFGKGIKRYYSPSYFDSDMHELNICKKLNNMMSDIIRQLDLVPVLNTPTLIIELDACILGHLIHDGAQTYKEEQGYQPTGIFANQLPIFVQNANGNTPAKYGQCEMIDKAMDTLQKLKLRNKQVIFRADNASYQNDVWDKIIYDYGMTIVVRYPRMKKDKKLGDITHWETFRTPDGSLVQIGELHTEILSSKHAGRLIYRRKYDPKNKQAREDGYVYFGIATNDLTTAKEEMLLFYQKRGGFEHRYKELKNDFLWKYLFFRDFTHNSVFLTMTAMIYLLFIAHKRYLVHHQIAGVQSHNMLPEIIRKVMGMPGYCGGTDLIQPKRRSLIKKVA